MKISFLFGSLCFTSSFYYSSSKVYDFTEFIDLSEVICFSLNFLKIYSCFVLSISIDILLLTLLTKLFYFWIFYLLAGESHGLRISGYFYFGKKALDNLAGDNYCFIFLLEEFDLVSSYSYLKQSSIEGNLSSITYYSILI